MIPELHAIERTRPKRSASAGKRNAPINWPIEPEAIRNAICPGVRPHFWISNGSVVAMVMTSKPSKKVAAPIRKRARTCIGLVGRRSIRAMIEPAVSAPGALAPPCAAIVLPNVLSSVLPNVLMSVPRPRMASMVLSERFGRIGQGRDVNRASLAHPLARELQVARHVDRNHAANGTRFQKEKTRAARIQVATYDRFDAGG